MVSSVQNSSISDIYSLQQKMQSFIRGKSSISKDDLSQIASNMKSKGMPGAQSVGNLVDNFSSIDTDNNGMTIGEVQSYMSSQATSQSQSAGFSLGFPPPGIFSNSTDGSVSNSTGQNMAQGIPFGPPPPPPGIMGNDSASGSANSVNSAQSGNTTPPNLTKDDLTQAASDMKSNGVDTTGIQNIIDNYDKIDTDGNGISPDEMQAYMNSQDTSQSLAQATSAGTTGTSTDSSNSGVSSVNAPHHHHHHHMMQSSSSDTASNSSNSDSSSNSAESSLMSNSTSDSTSNSTNLSSYLDKLLKNYLSFDTNDALSTATTEAVA